MNKLFYFLLFGLVVSCNSPNIKKEYYNSLKNFKYEFVNHFPEKLDSEDFFFCAYNPSISDMQCGFGIQLLVIGGLDLVSMDSSYKIIQTSNALTLGVDSVSQSADKGVFMMPDFYIMNHKIGTYGEKLSKDFVSYLVEAKQGVHEDEELLCERKELPKGWHHGMVKGISVSENRNIVLYWVEVW